MEIEIDSKKENPLLERTEIRFTIRHEGEGTPNREIIRSELAEKFNVKKDNVIVDNVHPGFGIQEIKGYAKVYKSVEKSKNWEREHILVRNKLIEKKVQGKKEKKPAAEKPGGKPEEAVKPGKEEEKPPSEEKKPESEEKPEEPEPKPAEEPPKEKPGKPPAEEPPKPEKEKPAEKATEPGEKPKEQPAKEEKPAEKSTEDKKE